MNVVFRHHTGEQATTAALDKAYGDAYEEIYSEPPYSSGPLFSRERFVERTVAQVERPGFTLVSAHDDLSLAGFAFGFTMAAGNWWGGQSTTPPRTLIDSPKLAIIELILRQKYRGQGTGRQLLRELLSHRAEPHATLLSHPDAPAHELYRRWGWQIVGTCRPAPDAPLMDAMALELH